ncbi:hypothetical protein EST38_g11136 [Candolleomyces aberdarensis]|uniref:Uncharacterized protein n=1 Tax=Candolleomyces aberdarensis TaxID=2316362 RepID=A0A4Q2D771_9AGAR|nr:hypothetical protein EST38_g11136 [Candolleomyces aberdarensis]
MSSPRPDTPEPSSKQGRRNGNNSQDVQLLDADGAISEKFEVCLKHVFAKYCTPSGLRQEGAAAEQQPADGGSFLVPPPNAYLSMKGLDEWAKDTNGTPFSQETKDELIEFLDLD